MVTGGAVSLGIAIDLIGNCNKSGSVRGSGGCVVGSGRLWSAVVAGGAVSLGIAIDLAPLEGLVVALSAVVGCGRRRRCRIGNCNRSGSVRGSGGCVVGSGRLWSAVVGRRCLIGNLGIAIDLAPLEGLVVALSALVGCGRLWSPAALSHWELQ